MTIPRPEPDFATDERTTLTQFLDYLRATLLIKCEGLSDDQAAAATVEPSILTLTGLVRHLAEVERSWLQRCFRGMDADPLYYDDANPDGDLEVDARTSLAEAIGTWREQVVVSDRVIAECPDLGDLALRPRHDGTPNMRWILVHMVEEYARHCGHADLLRERIDGTVGD